MILHDTKRITQEWNNVYCLEIADLSQSEIWNRYEEWHPWLHHLRPECREAEIPLHCTIRYDNGGHDQEYAQLWEEMEQGQEMTIKTMDIVSGPQGVAAMIKLPERMMNWYQEEETATQVTLMVAKDFESRDLGPMVKQAREVREWKPIRNPYLHNSPDGKYTRISVMAVDTVVASSVSIYSGMTCANGQMVMLNEGEDTDTEELLKDIPEHLWTKHSTDVGLMKSGGLAKIRIKENARLPCQRQYPLSKQAREGIRSTIHGLTEAGVLIPTRSQCNTPIFSVKKPDSDKWRLVHVLCAVNQVVIPETPVVPDPQTLLSNIPEGTKWYTVIDLCFSVF